MLGWQMLRTAFASSQSDQNVCYLGSFLELGLLAVQRANGLGFCHTEHITRLISVFTSCTLQKTGFLASWLI